MLMCVVLDGFTREKVYETEDWIDAEHFIEDELLGPKWNMYDHLLDGEVAELYRDCDGYEYILAFEEIEL